MRVRLFSFSVGFPIFPLYLGHFSFSPFSPPFISHFTSAVSDVAQQPPPPLPLFLTLFLISVLDSCGLLCTAEAWVRKKGREWEQGSENNRNNEVGTKGGKKKRSHCNSSVAAPQFIQSITSKQCKHYRFVTQLKSFSGLFHSTELD